MDTMQAIRRLSRRAGITGLGIVIGILALGTCAAGPDDIRADRGARAMQAFLDICTLGASTYERLSDGFTEAGWRHATAADEREIEAVLEMSRRAVGEELKIAVFATGREGSRIIGVVSDAAAGVEEIGCYVYALHTGHVRAEQVLASRITAEPLEQGEVEGQMRYRTWHEIAGVPGLVSIKYLYVHAGSVMESRLGAPGIYVGATAAKLQ
jgi:hypothetical protein